MYPSIHPSIVFYVLVSIDRGHTVLALSICSSVFSCWLPKALTLAKFLTLSQTSPGFYVSAVQTFQKHCGKRKNCSLRAISPFLTVFSICMGNFLPFSSNLKSLSVKSFNLEESKFCHLRKG